MISMSHRPQPEHDARPGPGPASANGIRRVRVLINLRSGSGVSQNKVRDILIETWDVPDIELTFQFSNSPADGRHKARQAIRDGIDTILVVGGDGMVNSIGSEVMGSRTALGVIPTGSGNGFARHFGIPLDPVEAAHALVHAAPRLIDVGLANGLPFFVTCSLAWDAAIVRTFERSPLRGVLPYVFSAMYEFLLGYTPQPFVARLDDGEPFEVRNPMVFTIANLTQFGGGARIAPHASPDDGYLELVTVAREAVPRVIPNMHRLFDGSVDEVKDVQTTKFRTLSVHRDNPGPVQLDGELMQDVRDMTIEIRPRSLRVLVPASPENQL